VSKALGQVESRDITIDQMGLELTTITVASTKNDLPKNHTQRDAILTKDLDIKGGMEEVNLCRELRPELTTYIAVKLANEYGFL
jgi:hypothetical protein